MTFTIFGAVITLVGLWLLARGSVMAMLGLMMVCSLFGGSAAMILTALGGSSVPPAQFALLFGVLRLFLPGSGRARAILRAMRATAALGLYALYGVFAAAFWPRFFRDRMWVAPMRPSAKPGWLFDTVPLAPSTSNVTVAVYMVGSFLAGLVAHVAMDDPRSPRRFVRIGVVIAWTHIAFGVLAAALKGTPFDTVVDVIRNANYTQTSQMAEGVVRITGIFPEPSSYVAFAFGWFVFLFECWLRDILPRRTGPVAAAMALVIVCSTASTAYVAFAAYATILALRYAVLPRYLGVRKGAAIAVVVLLLVAATCAVAIVLPGAIDAAGTMLRHMTIDKQHSDSGLQRAFWARIGLTAFAVSDWLGVGPGSFRSSSFPTAVLGSVGVIGAALLLVHLARALKPLTVSTYAGARDAARLGERTMIGAAAGWAAIGALIPASLIAPSCDVGSDVAIFTAVALALRAGRQARASSGIVAPGAWAPTAAST